jgi:hypothetical protein
MSSRASESPAALRLARAVAALALAFLLEGCISMEVPGHFLVLEEGTSEFKAVSPAEARIWVREFGDSNKGDLSFWSEVLKNDLVKNRGYTLLEEGKAKDGDGDGGLELVFEVTVGGAAQRYLVDLFVLEGWLSNTIVVVEFVAPKEVFEKDLDGVRKAVATLDP